MQRWNQTSKERESVENFIHGNMIKVCSRKASCQRHMAPNQNLIARRLSNVTLDAKNLILAGYFLISQFFQVISSLCDFLRSFVNFELLSFLVYALKQDIHFYDLLQINITWFLIQINLSQLINIMPVTLNRAKPVLKVQTFGPLRFWKLWLHIFTLYLQ